MASIGSEEDVGGGGSAINRLCAIANVGRHPQDLPRVVSHEDSAFQEDG
jgi:hypothetical protein